MESFLIPLFLLYSKFNMSENSVGFIVEMYCIRIQLEKQNPTRSISISKKDLLQGFVLIEQLWSWLSCFYEVTVIIFDTGS